MTCSFCEHNVNTGTICHHCISLCLCGCNYSNAGVWNLSEQIDADGRSRVLELIPYEWYHKFIVNHYPKYAHIVNAYNLLK